MVDCVEELEQHLIIREITEKDLSQLECFTCGNQSMDSYLISEAYANHCTGEGITKVIEYDTTQEIIGYYTLKCSEISIVDEDMFFGDRKLPCVEISRLAVLKSWQNGERGIHIGTHLMGYIINFIKEIISKHVGCMFIILHAVEEKVRWYREEFRFKAPLGEDPDRHGIVFMMLSINGDTFYTDYCMEHVNNKPAE